MTAARSSASTQSGSDLFAYLTKALTRGSFAERRVVLIGEPDGIDTSERLHRLRRCGYRPVECFPVMETDFGANNGMSPRLRSVLDQVIRTAESGRVEEILLEIHWDQRRLVDSIVTALRVPIPIRLVSEALCFRDAEAIGRALKTKSS